MNEAADGSQMTFSMQSPSASSSSPF